MSKDLKTIDLNTLSVETLAEMANLKAEMVEQNAQKTVSDAIDCGRYLTAIKQQIEHGKWAAWLGVNWNYSQSLASKYMSISNSERVPNLKDANSIREALRMIGNEKEEKQTAERADRIPDRVQVVESASEVGQPIVQADDDPPPNPPTNKKVSAGSKKVREEDKPQTQSVTPVIVCEPELVEPNKAEFEEKTLADFTFTEILEFIADSSAGDEKTVAKQLRKLADKLDPPSVGAPSIEAVEAWAALGYASHGSDAQGY
jgi:hypothetical protein